MLAIFAEQISCSGDTHESIVAVFTTKEKAEVFLAKLKEFWPTEHFYISRYYPPKVDPTFEDIVWEGISDETISDESETLLQREGQRRDSIDDFGWLSSM